MPGRIGDKMPDHQLVDRARALARAAALVESSMAAGETMGALRAAGKITDLVGEFAVPAAEQAAREGKTQRAIADALGIPPSTLTGLKQSVGVH
jgi:hypothetical protein